MMAAEEPTQPPPPRRRSGISMKVFLPLIAVLAVGSAGGFLSGRLSGKPPVKKKTGAASVEPARPTYDLGEFVVNLADENASHYAKITIVLELHEGGGGGGGGGHGGGHGGGKGGNSGLAEREPRIKDAVLEILTSKTYAQLLSLSGKKALKREILSKLQSIVGEDKVAGVLITGFAMQ